MDVVFYIEVGGGAGQGGVAGVLSFGEREHAVSFARLIARAGYTPRFVVGPRIANHIRLAGFEPTVFWTPQQGVEMVDAINPALVVGCELFNLSPDSANGLIQSGRPMGTIDGTSLAFELNTDPFKGSKYTRSLVLPDRYYAFRPCPINDIGRSRDTVFYWSLFPRVARAPKDAAHYASLGLDPSRKTVMFAAAYWAVVGAIAFGLEDYYQTLLTRIVDGLDASGEPVDLIFISAYRPPSLTIEGKGGVRVHYSGLLEYDSYDRLLASCDAIVSDNMIQTSVSKAIVMGTPHLIIQNMAPGAVPWPCNMFPLKVLFPAERDYAQIVETAELDDATGLRERLCAILTDGFWDRRARERRRDYVARLDQLPDPGSILEQIIGRAPATLSRQAIVQ